MEGGSGSRDVIMILLFADFASNNGITDSRVVVETTVETNLIFHARLFDDIEDFLNLIDIVVNRFLAEYMLAGAELRWRAGNAGPWMRKSGLP